MPRATPPNKAILAFWWEKEDIVTVYATVIVFEMIV